MTDQTQPNRIIKADPNQIPVPVPGSAFCVRLGSASSPLWQTQSRPHASRPRANIESKPQFQKQTFKSLLKILDYTRCRLIDGKKKRQVLCFLGSTLVFGSCLVGTVYISNKNRINHQMCNRIFSVYCGIAINCI